MAENIGKIQIAIEAQTADLKNGLKSAERAIKDSAKKMEATTDNLAQRAERSWTEFASKLGVITQVAQIAQQAIKALTDVAVVLGNEATTSAEKYHGVLNTLRDSGIPVLSQAISMGGMLRDWLDGTTEELAKWAKMKLETDKIVAYGKVILQMHTYVDLYRQSLADAELQLQANLKASEGVSNVEETFMLKRNAMERQFATLREKAIEQMVKEKVMADERNKLLRLMEIEQNELLDVLDQQENLAHKLYEAEQDRLEVAKKLAETAELERIEKEKIDKAKANADKELDLQTKLNIMLAKQAGDEEKAKLLAIEHRYKKELEFATEAQKKILLQMKEIEIAGAMEKAIVAEVPEVQKAMSGTASIATAIGGFTVATGVSKELKQAKKQTTLLETIAFNTSPKKGEMLISVAT
jgi:hypothetical protein